MTYKLGYTTVSAMMGLLTLSIGILPQAHAQPTVQIVMVLDGSGSISFSDFDLAKDAIASAVEDPNCIPQDGTVEFGMVQFAGGEFFIPEIRDGITYFARTEVDQTIITAATAPIVAAQVNGVLQGEGGTPMADGIDLARKNIRDSAVFGLFDRKVINLATDGIPTGAWSDPAGTTGDPAADVTAARNAAVAAGHLDELDAEAIGAGADSIYLRDEVVWPQSGTIAPPFDPGWVIEVSDFQEFADSVCEKFQVIVEKPVGGEILPIDVTTLFVAGAAANVYWIVPVLAAIAALTVAATLARRNG